jgi:hypothetical protein
MYVRRKVFSYSEPEEQLYSVTMSEEELDLFSEFMDGYYEALYSDESDVQSGRDIGTLAGAGVGAAALGGGFYGRAKYVAGRHGKYTNDIKELKNKNVAADLKMGHNKAIKELQTKAAEMKNAGYTQKQIEKALYNGKSEASYLKKLRGNQQREIANAVKEHGKSLAKAERYAQAAKFLKKNPKAVAAAAGLTGLAGAGVGAAIGRPVGGAVNR